jgi:hypothetical protein
MTHFKIIAIRTGDKPKRIYTQSNTGVKLDPLKNLNPNTIYKFYNYFDFPQGNFKEILYDFEKDLDLYGLHSTQNSVSVQINAIVGSNGSGKSSLIELLYWANYNIGCQLGLLKDENGKKLKPYKFLDLEIFYSIDRTSFIKIDFKDGIINQQGFRLEGKYITPEENKKNINKISDLSGFFYSIVVNYSHYALNSLEIGDWINPLFHKNDGYQTPIVISPMRTNGNIDVNREKQLLVRRLQANLLENIGEEKEENSIRNLVNGKVATKLKLTYISRSAIEKPIDDTSLIRSLVKAIENHFGFTFSSYQIRDIFTEITINYILEKLIKMADNYRPFRKFKDGNSIKYVDAFIRSIRDSNSHIVFKVKGAIMYLKYYKEIFGKIDFVIWETIVLSIADLSKTIKEIDQKEETFWVNTFMMVPPSFFQVEIELEDGSSFDALSSGEKQRIHSVSSIVYHLINLNSVEQQKSDESEGYKSYPYINVILDEIELYYHPEWQRQYITDLLDYIGKINSKNLSYIEGINITFLTHSPYILSDIPASNTLRLKDGYPIKSEEFEQTFGANIHDLLANDFFMNNGFMGEWAKRKIKGVISFLNYNLIVKRQKELEETLELQKGTRLENRANEQVIETEYYKSGDRLNERIIELENEIKLNNSAIRKKKIEILSTGVPTDSFICKSIIDMIGEPVIKNKLQIMFDEVFENDKNERIAKQRIEEIARKAGIQVDFKRKG